MDLTHGSVPRLENAAEIARYAQNAVRNAGVLGKLPTPIDELLAAARVGNLRIDEAAKESFRARLSGFLRDSFDAAWQKVRGIADLRERVVYIDQAAPSPRILFAKGHELGHEVLPWQKLDPGFFDEDKNLTWEAEEDFDREANLFSSEVIFQGERFVRIVRDFSPGLETIFHVAGMHGASRHATAWRYVEAQDEPIALLLYWPSKFHLNSLWRSRPIVSPSFRQRYNAIDIPDLLVSDHPWAAAWHSSLIHRDTISLACDGTSQQFTWEAWWNGHAVLVMLRRKPVLHFVRNLVEKTGAISH